MPLETAKKLEEEIERYLGWGRKIIVSRPREAKHNGALVGVSVEAEVSPEISGADLLGLGQRLKGDWSCTQDNTGRIVTAELDGLFDTTKCHVKLIRHVAETQ